MFNQLTAIARKVLSLDKQVLPLTPQPVCRGARKQCWGKNGESNLSGVSGGRFRNNCSLARSQHEMARCQLCLGVELKRLAKVRLDCSRRDGTDADPLGRPLE